MSSKKATGKKPQKTPSEKKTKKAAKPRSGVSGRRKRASGEGVQPWAERFKDEPQGPWTCPKCGPLPARANPFYGEDERHHCPNDSCDAVVTLLSKEDLEPAERRGSWPPQRNKGKAPPGGPPMAPPSPAELDE